MGARRHRQEGAFVLPLENVLDRFASITTFLFTQKNQNLATKHVSPTQIAFVARVLPCTPLGEFSRQSTLIENGPRFAVERGEQGG